VDVDQDYAAHNGVTVEAAQNIVVLLLEVISFVAMDRSGPVDCPVQKACAAQSGVTVEQTQNIVPPGAISSQPPELHD
jgi:hypothetical protein